MKKIYNLCNNYNLGKLINEPTVVTGGLMHKMYHVSTDQGEYAIKVLNPDIMKRPEALANMINSEKVSNSLLNIIPLVAAKTFNGKNILEFEGSYFGIFDWLDGQSIYAPDITEYHCEKIGQILGKIHSSLIKIDTIEMNYEIRDLYDWNMLLENAKQNNNDVYLLMQENLENIMCWDRNVIGSLHEISQNQVLSHRDLDPKNVMWHNNEPYIIDWEAAGYVNPFQELIEVFNYWITDNSGYYDKAKFDALMNAYTEDMDINDVDWEAILNCSYDGMLGWLEYSLKRALGIENADINEQQEGFQQAKGTILELKNYTNQIEQLRYWLKKYK